MLLGVADVAVAVAGVVLRVSHRQNPARGQRTGAPIALDWHNASGEKSTMEYTPKKNCSKIVHVVQEKNKRPRQRKGHASWTDAN